MVPVVRRTGGLADTVMLASVIWGINGWFQGFGAPGSVVALTSWFSNSERGRVYGLWNTSHSMGEGLSFFVIGWVVANWGWRFGYFVPAMIGFVIDMMRKMLSVLMAWSDSGACFPSAFK